MNPLPPVEQPVLGRDAGPIALHSYKDHRRICRQMLEQTRHDLCLLTRDLNKAVFDQAEFVAGLQALATRSRGSRIRILLQDHDAVVKQGHRIVELARRLTSSVEIRLPASDWTDYPENFLLADDYGVVHQSLASSYEATADFHAPLKVRRLRAQFDEIWETAEPDTELRRLHL
jgi:hypothetical protein